jgi:hypothetical protein
VVNSSKAVSTKLKSKLMLDRIINFQKYPIQNLLTHPCFDLIQQCRNQLTLEGYCILNSFITPHALALARVECESLSPLAHHTVRYTNPYKTNDDPFLPQDHPIRSFALRTNAFISQAKFSKQSIFLTIYRAAVFKRFIAACLDRVTIYEYADPLGGLVLNVLRPGGQHPWHFDENDFSIVLTIRTPEDGGHFEIAPDIRTAEAENYEWVAQVLKGERDQVKQIELLPGDLHIFRGKMSLHRVTQTLGETERHTIVFSYTQEPGVIGRVENNTQIFDRAAH